MDWSREPHLLDEIESKTVHNDKGDRESTKKKDTERSRLVQKEVLLSNKLQDYAYE